jgi:hypothetical protein|tara:strand:+ start:553 stop:837 length:285 start_codon:yes stop_codon:yes gene_type:complete
MRIYVKNPGRFAKYKGQVVLTHFQDTNNTIIRDNYGDIQRVNTDKLEAISIVELNEALESDESLREVASHEEYITVGEPKYDDVSYMKYVALHC